jgi:hypothetical protein
MPPLASRLLGTLTSVDELYKYVGIPVAMVGNEFPDYATGIVMIADVKHPCLSGCPRQARPLENNVLEEVGHYFRAAQNFGPLRPLV